MRQGRALHGWPSLAVWQLDNPIPPLICLVHNQASPTLLPRHAGRRVVHQQYFHQHPPPKPSPEIYLAVEVENEYFTVHLSDQLPTSCCCIWWLVGEKGEERTVFIGSMIERSIGKLHSQQCKKDWERERESEGSCGRDGSLKWTSSFLYAQSPGIVGKQIKDFRW